MLDPRSQTPSEFQFYAEQKGLPTQREFERSSIPGLEKSLNKAHDNLQKQVGINTRLYEQVTKGERRLDRYKIMLWVLTAVVIGEGYVIGWLATELFSRLK